MTSYTIDTKTDEEYKEICRLVDLSMLSTFLGNFPLNNLSDEERRRLTEFGNYVLELENKAFMKMGVFRWGGIHSPNA